MRYADYFVHGNDKGNSRSRFAETGGANNFLKNVLVLVRISNG